MVIFVRLERTTAQQMVDLRLFGNRLLNVNLITGFMVFIAVAGAIVLIPFYLENVLGYDTRQVGFMLAALPVALGVTAPVSGWLSDRFGTRPLTVIGLAVLVVAYYTLSTLTGTTTVSDFVWRYALIGLGVGIFQSPNNSAIMGSAPREQLGVVSGLLAVTRTLGQTTGIAVLGALWAGRVFFHEGMTLAGGVTEATPLAQVAGMQDTFIAAAILIFFALCLGVWGLTQERQQKRNS
jgi:MFS family permease